MGDIRRRETGKLRWPFLLRSPISCLLWVILLHTARLVTSRSHVTHDSFQFTSSLYNATIYERTLVGKSYIVPTHRMGIAITDPNINIRYKIQGGDENKMFKAEQRIVGDFCFLSIRTRTQKSPKVINRESQKFHTLRIKAIGRRAGVTLHSNTKVVIKVLDINDLSPIFDKTEYTVSIGEDAPIFTTVTMLSAYDADIGINAEVYYSIQPIDDTFSIHPSTGAVYTTGPLNAQLHSEYVLDITARDRGPKGLPGVAQVPDTTVKLTIHVTKTNFFPPRILTQRQSTLVENGVVGTVYAVLSVSDKDSQGNNGDIDSVKIIDGDPHGYFSVHQTNRKDQYTIEVEHGLDRELTPEGYQLTIQATDKGTPPMSTTASIAVNILDSNDNSPVFTEKDYTVRVNETVPIGTPLLFASARDHDIGKNQQVKYRISKGNHHSWFQIHRETGLILTASVLDAEQYKQVELTVTAEDQANPGTRRTGKAKVLIKIIDCNDNTPVLKIKSAVSVKENLPVGTEVYKVRATDEDEGDNSFISYSIANMNDVPFTIDHFTGILRTKQVLDYESMRRTYKLTIRASDWGMPFRRESEKVLTVNVLNDNDNKPQFESVDCTGYLSRDTPGGTELITVSALDYDIGNVVSYEIIHVSGDHQECFDLNSKSGTLFLSGRCDIKNRKLKDLSVKVSAYDERNRSEPTTINITLVHSKQNAQLSDGYVSIHCRTTGVVQRFHDLLKKVNKNAANKQDVMSQIPIKYTVNQHSPKFVVTTTREIKINESLPIGTVIFTVEAHDKDPTYNGMVTYVISDGNVDDCFRVDTFSGQVKVVADVDREQRDVYHLNITASDLGSPTKSSSHVVIVRVKDVNDLRPHFDRSLYQVSVKEDIELGTNLQTVAATDEDMGDNAKISYVLATPTRNFEIEATTGVITVVKPLDREKQDGYLLKVKAIDHGSPVRLTSVTTVHVKVLDVNDKAPRFTPEVYRVKIREDIPKGAVVMTISAQDLDLGDGGKVTYRLLKGHGGKFSVNPSTGIIRLVRQVDYERKQIYNITAEASDGTFSTKCSVFIEIVDVNENFYAPKFKSTVLKGSIKENELVGTTVLQVTARDKDKAPRDRKLSYSIREGTGLGRFTIDQKGVIRTNEVLDRETARYHWLTVYAQDGAVVPLTTSVEVLVEVLDLNDNIPQTSKAMYISHVPENSAPGTVVQQIQASDNDENSLDKLTYRIIAGNPQGFFHINGQTGLITTTRRRLDREKQEEHILEVQVNDNGVPNLASTARVIVHIEDENDHPPLFTEKLYRAFLPNVSTSNYVFRVVAFDKDLGKNADIDYSIKGSRFKIDPKTGVITSQRHLEDGFIQYLEVKAVDNGRPQKKSSGGVHISVVGAPLASPNPPRFETPQKRCNVMENEKVKSRVCIMDAIDPDDDERLWYTITGGNTDLKFYINMETGSIRVARQLDREVRGRYNLTVSVTDGVHMSHSWVLITVLDVNDNRPVFRPKKYTADISEDADVGSDVITVTATDRDEDKRLSYTLHFAAHTTSMSLFEIHSETGVISTKKRLDRESLATHQLTVMVRDHGTPSKRSLARVTINVKDHNDHKPQFLSEKFSGQVYETSAIGSSILTVIAIDKDRGPNAKISYFIISGNTGNVFSIDKLLGVISVAKELDQTVQMTYTLTVRAIDSGDPALSTTVSVHIAVTVSNNAPPRFTQAEYSAEVKENQQEGTYVTAIYATSRSSITYDIISGNNDRLFTVNPNSGVVSTQEELDYEKQRTFNLTVTATNMLGAVATATVLVNVADENDNYPEFSTQTEYHGNITEGSSKGKVVLTNQSPLVVRAYDLDKNLNGLLNYHIVEQEAKKIFSIDPNTGAIWVNAVLDHEQQDSYSFTVQVRDKGTPQHSAKLPALVTVRVLDINDSPPVFEKVSYKSTLLLPTYKGVAVTRVKATDADTDVASDLVYDITHGNDGSFSIEEDTGIIRVTDKANLKSRYSLTVVVSDGKHTGRTKVAVTVTPARDTGLRFTQSQYSADIMENRTDLKQVAMVQVTGHDLNEHLTFKILNPTKMFIVGKTSGVVQTTGLRLDREDQDNYIIVVEVRDSRTVPRVAHTLVNVTVLDSNDNQPIFINQPYYAVVSIDANEGDLVKMVAARDMDIGTNSDIVYNVVSGDKGKFAINNNTGEIFLAKSLSSEDQNTEYSLIIAAQDKGEVPMSSRVLVTLKIINKATPIFSRPFYTIDVLENIKLHSTLISIEAKSPHNRKLIYSLLSGDIFDEFAVDFSTDMTVISPCAITLIDELDYEMNTKYDLIIRATDTLTGAYADALVKIKVKDVNDQKPSFTQQVYYKTVSEAVTKGTPILTVLATDGDSGPNKVISYHIQTSRLYNDSDYFFLDQTTGVIYTKLKLDHEQKSEYQFVVIATDSGVPALSSTTHVHVTVDDLNDNAPRFDHPSYSATITDQAKKGQFVTMVTASDQDSSDRGKLMYSIVNGNERSTFTINSNRGIIALTNSRNPDLKPSYTLNISVTDGVFTNFAHVIINVQNSNQHKPVFTNIVYEVKFSENQNVGSSVHKVSASDRDRGDYGDVTYSINSQAMLHVFAIDSQSGEITTRRMFDRESERHYRIPVVATDGGFRSGYATVHVTVGDKDDNKPLFGHQEYKANVYASAKVDTSILKVKASDSDQSQHSEVEYTIVDGEKSKASILFKIHKRTGVIKVKTSLIKSENKLYQFFINAKSKGTGGYETTVPIQLYVMADNDYPPIINKVLTPYFISEDVKRGTAVTTLTAASNETIKFRIVPGTGTITNHPTRFAIDQSGTITVAQSLDHEETNMYELLVQAETKTTPPLVDMTTVAIKILDVNDNIPWFDTSPYNVTIIESTRLNSKLLQIIAYDNDTGANGEITYSFSGSTHEMYPNQFFIEPKNGWIKNVAKFDRETLDFYELEVVATDNGKNKPLKSTATVRLNITDANDEPPRFSKEVYDGSVAEDSLPGTVVTSITTTDKDTGINARVTYYISQGDILGQFSIKKDGQICVNRPLDRETSDKYDLQITATDGAFISRARVMVTVTDANDNEPKCERPLYEAIIPENIAVGSPVDQIMATDADQENTHNSRIQFTMYGTGSDLFKMDSATGMLTTRKKLDRETIPEFNLVVRAEDGGHLYCTSHVQVILTDYNDCAPIFNSDDGSMNITIPEDAAVNTLVTRVTAFDNDVVINRKVRYGIKKNSLFGIDSVSGIIQLMGALDREQHDTHDIVVFAMDQGTPKMTSSAIVHVTVTDINDNPPQFERTRYDITVSERTQVKKEVARVLATSKDTGKNAKIQYSILTGNNEGLFAIDYKTGALSLLQPLDYESNKQYFLTVLAQDSGSPPLSSTAAIRVKVTDWNDNPPVFGQSQYPMSVPENKDIGEQLLQVQATDADGPDNNQITYAIKNGDELGQFKINPKDGVIRLHRALDRETMAHYHLEVTAEDSGLEPFVTSVIVNVVVEDYNDNAPQFSLPNYTAVVQQDQEVGFKALQFKVTDNDLDPNGPPFVFEVFEENSKTVKEFKVDKNGNLITTSRFNRQIKDTYPLTVRVFDSGTPILYSDVSVIVKIINESAFSPHLIPLQLNINSYDDQFPGGVIGRLKATDRDMYDKLTFGIVSHKELFDISHNGTITTIPGLDAGVYILNVSVTDGKFTSYGTVRLNVDIVTDLMVKHSVTIRFSNMLPEQFIKIYRDKFVKLISKKLSVQRKDVLILAVQPATASMSTTRRRRQVSDADLDVLVAIRKPNKNHMMKRKSLQRKLKSFASGLEQTVGTSIEVIYDVCQRGACGEKGHCVTDMVFDKKRINTIIMENESFVTGKYVMVARCQCKDGFTGPRCDRNLPSPCASRPCRDNTICHPTTDTEYTCVCRDGTVGPICGIMTPAPSVPLPDDCKDDIKCRYEKKPLSFNGESYVRWRMLQSIESELQLTLMLKTHQESYGMIMYATGVVDKSVLEIQKGMIRYVFNCGSGEGVVEVDRKFNDGKWHHIQVIRRGNNAEVTVDKVFTAKGSAPGNNVVLNLYDSDVYFGAQIEELKHGDISLKNAFKGCINDTAIFGKRLPYFDRNQLAIMQKMEKVDFKCEELYGVCRNRPCQNGGVCELESALRYSCMCHVRFRGSNCEIDTDPCASSPCMHGGTCTNLENDFKCQCKNKLSGKRCDYGYYCGSQPCKNGGTCIEGTNGPRCKCMAQFQGDLCEDDLDECLESPCKNNALCHNTHGAFLCNCSTEYFGRFCEEINYASITSSTNSISMEEIIVIAGVGTTVIIIVILIVALQRWYVRRKRRRHQSHTRDTTLGRDSHNMMLNFNPEEYKQRNKILNDYHTETASNHSHSQNTYPSPSNSYPSPQPPPVPKRPESYAPSTHDSVQTLNNLDTVRNYNTNPDEDLENLPKYEIQIPDFILQNIGKSNLPPNLPVAASNSSDNDSIQKPQWEFEYPTTQQNMETFTGVKSGSGPRHFVFDNHQYSAVPPQVHLSQYQGEGRDTTTVGSCSSLQVSESEDDLPGYHWDTSDWAPNPVSLPNITEVPMHEVPDSASSSSHGNNAESQPTSRNNAPESEIENVNYDSEFPENESEYVGDSEFAHDEFDDEGGYDSNMDLPDPPNYEHFLQMPVSDMQYEDYEPGQFNYNLHPNQYLPNHSYNGDTSNNGSPENKPSPPLTRGNHDSSVNQGPSRQYNARGNVPRRFPLDYGNSDFEQGAIDDMSVTGYDTSTNASCSDISGLCDIEDSEINLSEGDSNDSDDDRPSISNAHLHTQV